MSKLIVLSAPSGSGKTTIARELLSRHPDFRFSVSATTRPKREQERDGVDYFFLGEKEFKELIARDGLVEWECIYGDYYGSLRSEVDRSLAAGYPLVFDIDVKGALSIKRRYGNKAVLIFIKPPSVDELLNRLRNRNTESEETLRTRLERVPMELAHEHDFDYAVVNERLHDSVKVVEEIVERELSNIEHS